MCQVFSEYIQISQKESWWRYGLPDSNQFCISWPPSWSKVLIHSSLVVPTLVDHLPLSNPLAPPFKDSKKSLPRFEDFNLALKTAGGFSKTNLRSRRISLMVWNTFRALRHLSSSGGLTYKDCFIGSMFQGSCHSFLWISSSHTGKEDQRRDIEWLDPIYFLEDSMVLFRNP